MSEPDSGDGRRRRAARLLAGLAALLSTLLLVVSYAGHALLDADQFSDRVVAAARDPAVSSDIADRLTTAVVGVRGGDLAPVRPLVRIAAGAIVNTGAFAALLRRAALEAHRAVVERDGGAVLVNVADAGVLVQGVLERFAPDRARRIGAERIANLLTVRPGHGALAAVRSARRIDGLLWLALPIIAGLALLSIRMSTDAGRGVTRLGIALGIGGLLIVAAYLAGLVVVARVVPLGRGPAARGLWRAFLAGLQSQALVLAATGVVVAAAGSAWQRRGAVSARWRGLPRLHTDGPPVAQWARATLLIAAGAALLIAPQASLTLVAVSIGLLGLYLGVSAVLPMAMSAVRRMSPRRMSPGRPSVGGAGRLLAPAVAIAALVAAGVILAGGGEDEAPGSPPLTCNGSRALCGRTLDHVALAATHNSMSSVTIPTFLFGQQDGTIREQLDDGIRGLLIDSYYGDATRDRVRTDLASLPKRQVAVQQIGAAAVKAAERIRARLARGRGRRGIYLCHGFCEIGAVSLRSALDDLRAFLVANPGEVVVIINQDEGVAPRSLERAFANAGLLDLVYRGPLGPFPTLRQMIDSGQRLVVMAENDAGDIPWYHLAYEKALQETPYRFTRPEQLADAEQLPASCRPNRGPSSAPLFLLNHWIDTTPVPRPSLASRVNARSVLLRRVRACERIRHRLPNLVAVDFYRRGDVMGVVDTLNGVGR